MYILPNIHKKGASIIIKQFTSQIIVQTFSKKRSGVPPNARFLKNVVSLSSSVIFYVSFIIVSKL